MLDRSIAPAIFEPQKFELPTPQVIGLSNQSKFYHVNIGDQPVIKLEFVFRSGNWFESMPGVAYFTGKMLSEGTTSFISRDISELLAQYGAFVEFHSGMDFTDLSIHVPTQHFEKIVSVIHELLFQPTFPKSEFELMQQIQIQQLAIQEQKNNFVASRLFRSKLYGEHPYGHLMTKENIQSISVESLQDHYEQYVHGRFDIFLTGKFEDSLPEKIAQYFGQELKPIPEFDENQVALEKQTDIYKEIPDSLQSSIFMGKRCFNREDKDYSKALLLNEVFGGYFGSRLMQNIREEKGLTYGIHSHMASMKKDAYFVINTSVKKENHGQAVEEICKEIEILKTELIGNEELHQAKKHLKGSILNSLTTPFVITEKIKNIELYGLGMDFYTNLFDEIDNTTAEELHRIANSRLFDSPLSTVVVG